MYRVSRVSSKQGTNVALFPVLGLVCGIALEFGGVVNRAVVLAYAEL